MKLSKKTLVLGASTHPYRYSYLAIHKLRRAGHPVIAIGKTGGEVYDVSIIKEKKVLQGVNTVTLYLNPKHQESYYDYILSLQPERVIFNPGTENPEFYKILDENNIEYEVACTLILLGTDQY